MNEAWFGSLVRDLTREQERIVGAISNALCAPQVYYLQYPDGKNIVWLGKNYGIKASSLAYIKGIGDYLR